MRLNLAKRLHLNLVPLAAVAGAIAAYVAEHGVPKTKEGIVVAVCVLVAGFTGRAAQKYDAAKAGARAAP